MRKLLPFILLTFLPGILAAQGRKVYNLLMRNTGVVTLWDGTKVTAWGFTNSLGANVTIPNPTLEAEEGDSVIVTVWNMSQGDPHSIHWHGLDVDSANDGVMPAVEHSKKFTYRFKAQHPGLYFYHCHFLSVVHVQMGMYGKFVVRPKGKAKTVWANGPGFKSDTSWLFSEIDPAWHYAPPGGNNHSHTNGHTDTVKIPPYKPKYFLVNGKSEKQLHDSARVLQLNPGDTFYLRLGNMGFLSNTVTFPASIRARVVESDGRPLPQPVDTNVVRLMPGERYGVLLSAKADGADSITVSYEWMHNRLTANEQRIPVRTTATGFGEVSEEMAFSLYPNPSDGRVMLRSAAGFEKYSVQIYDDSGRKVWEGIVRAGEKSFDYSHLSKGVYSLRLVAGGKIGIRKLVIQ